MTRSKPCVRHVKCRCPHLHTATHKTSKLSKATQRIVLTVVVTHDLDAVVAVLHIVRLVIAVAARRDSEFQAPRPERPRPLRRLCLRPIVHGTTVATHLRARVSPRTPACANTQQSHCCETRMCGTHPLDRLVACECAAQSCIGQVNPSIISNAGKASHSLCTCAPCA